MADWSKVLKDAVFKGDEEVAEDAAERGLSEGIAPIELLQKGAVAGIYEAGALWQAGEYFLPDVILAAEAFNAAMKSIEPALEGTEGHDKGLVVLGSVEGDAHDLGKNIVSALLRSAGYEVMDLGIDVSTERFVDTVRDRNPKVLGLGAYMTTTMRQMEGIIHALEQAGLRSGVKVVVGGAAVTEEFSRGIGADGYAQNAMDAVELLDGLTGAR